MRHEPVTQRARWTSAVFCGLALALGTIAVSGAENSTVDGAAPSPPAADDASADEFEEGGKLTAEGSELVDLVGHFRVQGERLAFHATNQPLTLVALENLALERIAQQVNETPKLLEWSVSGDVTEYRGANYLLVKRAHLRPSLRRNLPEL